jgi:hypothetical protein
MSISEKDWKFGVGAYFIREWSEDGEPETTFRFPSSDHAQVSSGSISVVRLPLN